jgi:hypothetical protein
MTRRFTAWVITAGWITIALSACAPALYPPVVYAPPAYAPGPVAPPAETPFVLPPGGATPPATMCDMQGTCYPSGPPRQIYHGDPTHPDRETAYPPPEITNHPPVIVPPSSNDGAPQ